MSRKWRVFALCSIASVRKARHLIPACVNWFLCGGASRPQSAFSFKCGKGDESALGPRLVSRLLEYQNYLAELKVQCTMHLWNKVQPMSGTNYGPRASRLKSSFNNRAERRGQQKDLYDKRDRVITWGFCRDHSLNFTVFCAFPKRSV